ncbi:hypothetical protein H2248_001700 [Termitomyces sp. 'cryptogamus']|nr:hypothetical protein H2248_001700 [Termitomyces sp. 'cryptogamus']
MFRRYSRRNSGDNGARARKSSDSSSVDLTSSTYARKCRKLMKLHRDLSNLCDGIPLNMPRLAVIGSQSAGKSSLVEAVSGICVPRDSGTCTRCPMECSMSTTEGPWSCNISLRISYASDGESVVTAKSTQFGPTITDKKDVEIWIRRAQAALLNPLLSHSDFFDKTEKELKKRSNALQFSKNVVCVHISDPDLTDLSFIDLPGLIQNSNDEDITLIRNLVVNAVSGSNTLILVTIPMSDDMQNQAAFRLAKDADPAGERTIGVLTKPDTLSAGATGHLQNWKDTLEGKLYPLKHGYYCVRLPNDAERNRNRSHVDFQKLESRFFESTSPWNTIADRARFGVPSFVANISGLLVQLIEKNLPELRAKVAQLLSECKEELATLPALSTSDPFTEVCLRITQFCQDFQSAVFGEQQKSMVRTNRNRYNDFKRDIERTRPNFLPDRVRHYGSIDREAERVPAIGPVIDVQQVKQAISSSIGWELPTHVPYDATKNYILTFTSLWNQPAIACFHDVFANTSEFIRKVMGEHFGQFKNLEKHVASVVQVDLQRFKKETLERLAEMIELEDVSAWTQNEELFRSEKDFWLRVYYNAAKSSYIITPSQQLHDVNRNDGDFDVLNVMAMVRAYFQVAHKRVIDYVPLTIEHALNQAFTKNLRKSLFESLQLDPSDEADYDWFADLLIEDPLLAKKRTFLEDRKDRLELIKKRLDTFERGTED